MKKSRRPRPRNVQVRENQEEWGDDPFIRLNWEPSVPNERLVGSKEIVWEWVGVTIAHLVLTEIMGSDERRIVLKACIQHKPIGRGSRPTREDLGRLRDQYVECARAAGPPPAPGSFFKLDEAFLMRFSPLLSVAILSVALKSADEEDAEYANLEKETLIQRFPEPAAVTLLNNLLRGGGRALEYVGALTEALWHLYGKEVRKN